ncbi:energy transducer TonB [sulfur-oxidizing endosymbiont of Gigantopelta aegis]|uniref:energy transducer TonB n=1 Tax=sulfur-oxidizing endosymbiont of Gigantopelta aegis TaxID=2794934 RepID=UPI001BE4268F|nr:TonB family protein [sulfur-oxidizing endosymbiont of Gigantopelta aegis]
MMHADSSNSHWLSSNHTIWFFAIALSLSAHALLLLQSKTLYQAAPAMVIQETITQVRFANSSPPPVTVIETKPKEVPVEAVIIPPKTPEPEVKISKPEPKIVKKTPRVKKKAKTKKVSPKKRVVKQPKVKVTPQKKSTTKKTSNKPPASTLNNKPKINQAVKASPLVSQSDQRLLEQTRKNYHALLMRHIEVQKHYPRIARKRKIEGKIIVSFTLLANGKIKNLLINGQRSILNKASKNAVMSALPMPKPPHDLTMPMEIKFAMNYFLK